jgi:hypothetical protein
MVFDSITLSNTYLKYISESVYKCAFLIFEKNIRLAFIMPKIYNIKKFIVYTIGLNMIGSSLNTSKLLYIHGCNMLFN